MSSTRARHRAARRPVTPLTTLAQAATGQFSTVGRRTAVVAASSGLLVSMIGAASPAMAATATDQEGANLNSSGELSAQAQEVLHAAPAVTVPATASFPVEQVQVTVTPAPKPKPVVQERKPTVSRTEARTTPKTTTPKATTTRATTQQATATTKQATSAVPAQAAGSQIISIASRYVGVPYVYGGSTPAGFDCSGFVSYVYAQVGISLPHSSSAIGAMGTKIPRSEAKPGDLIWTPGHIAIYAGGNTIIDAPRPGKTIQFRPMYQTNPTFIRIS